ncbi:hypothetical protein [Legionella brunensis]|uniref:hypothetical protein n=1 Tax=Legionella brunensis TaxID=29422 RepID=UPI00104166B3|nr:hypothetical protein [Legionella brunensis]
MNKALKKAAESKEWGIVEYFCTLESNNKPNQEAVSNALKRAAEEQNWDTVILLCSIKTENKPDEQTIAEAQELRKKYCGEKTDNRQNEEETQRKQFADEDEKDHYNQERQEKGTGDQQSEKETQHKQFADEDEKDQYNEERQEKGTGDQQSEKETQHNQFADEDKKDQYNDEKRQEADRTQTKDSLSETFEKDTLDKTLEQKRTSREEIIASTIPKINKALATLQQKIGDIDKHHFREAFAEANKLLSKLQEAKTQYLNDLNNVDIKTADANHVFKEQCHTLINNAKTVLERDLGWGDYLSNLFKAIANAVIRTVTFGNVNTFFNYARSESVLAIEEAEQSFKSIPDLNS